MKLAETGPIATAFWRGALAVPFLFGWAALERRGPGPQRSWDARFLWAGFFFAGDLAFWHWSLLLTSVAASTLEANLAPVFVTLFVWLLYRERPRALFLLAIVAALAGVFAMVSPKIASGEGALLGDVLGVVTALFYGAYLLVVARLRTAFGTGIVMLQSTVFYTLLLLPFALTEQFVPMSVQGWGVLAALAFVAQFLGQSLIAYALAHLPATQGAVGLYLQPVAATVYAWIFLGERLLPIQIAGGVLVLAAIALARASVSVPSR